MHSKLIWKSNMNFECINNQHSTQIDAPTDHGGQGLGPTPKELLLNAMMGCTAMDSVSILNKMRQKIDSFKMEIEAEKNDEHPIHFIHAHMQFFFEGELEESKVIKAVTKSLTQYCGINYMISKTCEIKYTILLNKTQIYSAIAFD